MTDASADSVAGTSRVMLLMTTRTYRAAAFLGAAERLGLAVTVASERPQVLASANPIGSITVSFDRPREAIETIVRFARRHPLGALIATDDDGVLLAAVASEALRLPHNSVYAVGKARDKYLTRQALAAAGLRTPPFQRATTKSDPPAIADAVGFPCVVKPLSLAASRGVIRADDSAQLAHALQRTAAIARRHDSATDGDSEQNVLVERYIPGVEVAVEGIVQEGDLRCLAIFDKPDLLEGPYFEETIYVTPSRLGPGTRRRIAEEAAAAVRALGLRTGPIHAELRVNDEGVWVIEVAPRTIGGLCARTLRFRRRSASGAAVATTTLEELVLLQALGSDVDEFEREDLAAGVMMLPSPRSGILLEVRGQEEALSVDGIQDLMVTIPIGGRVVPLPEGSRYLGFLFARGETPERVEAALREAHGKLTIEIAPTHQAQPSSAPSV